MPCLFHCLVTPSATCVALLAGRLPGRRAACLSPPRIRSTIRPLRPLLLFWLHRRSGCAPTACSARIIGGVPRAPRSSPLLISFDAPCLPRRIPCVVHLLLPSTSVCLHPPWSFSSGGSPPSPFCALLRSLCPLCPVLLCLPLPALFVRQRCRQVHLHRRRARPGDEPLLHAALFCMPFFDFNQKDLQGEIAQRRVHV